MALAGYNSGTFNNPFAPSRNNFLTPSESDRGGGGEERRGEAQDGNKRPKGKLPVFPNYYCQSLGWEHYEVHEPEPHILLFK